MTKSSEGKPFYKRGWFVAVAAVVVLAGVGRAERRAAEERAGSVGRSEMAAAGGDTGMSGERGDSAHARAGSAAAAAGGGAASGGGVAVASGTAASGTVASGTAASGTAAPGTASGAAASGTASEAEAEGGASWRYSEREDVMTGQVTRAAVVESSNSHDLGFPYQGGTVAEVTIRKHPRHGVDALVSVNRGQITCSSFNGCRVMVRFDERPPIKFRGVEPSDFDSTMVFLEPAAKFIKEARRAKKAAVELELFQEGTRVFLFDVGGLVWE